MPNPTYSIAELILGELNHFRKHFHPEGGERTFQTQLQLTHEPFIGYVRVADRNKVESQYLICRHYTPQNFQPSDRSVEFASYLSPLGRIIAKTPGQDHQYIIAEAFWFRLLEKDEFRPHLEDGSWDAINNQIAWIFPVEFIKGLEFEAVFFVGLDSMAEIHRDLIDKYVYVGLSRARSFLGVTVERQFPQRLQCIAHHFVQEGNWNLNP